MADEHVTLINAFEVPPEDAERFVALWAEARDYLETQPGYIDTALHRSLGPDADFQFVNVAHWASAEEFQTAIRSAGFAEASAPLGIYQNHASLYRVVRT